MEVTTIPSFNCRSCSRSDSIDNMVECDRCDGWHHFGCVGVDASIKEREWNCKECEGKQKVKPTDQLKVPTGKTGKSTSSKAPSKRSKKPEKPIGSKTSLTSSARAALLDAQMKLVEEQEKVEEEVLRQQEKLEELQFAEQQRQLQEKKRLLEEEKIMHENDLARQKTLQEKRMLLKKQSIEQKLDIMRKKAELSSQSSVSGVSVLSITEKVKQWLNSQGKQTEGEIEDKPNGQNSTSKSLGQQPAPPAIPDDVQASVSQIKAPPGSNLNNVQPLVDPPAANHNNASPNANQTYALQVVPVVETNQNIAPLNVEHNISQSRANQHIVAPAVDQNSSPTNGNQRTANLRANQVNFPSHVAPPAANHNFAAPSHLRIGTPSAEYSSNPFVLNNRRLQFPFNDGPDAVGSPTYVQIAARQVTGKDLPTFSGDPEDWPIFIRLYEETTAACGFSNVENLVRLQKCLKGNALETVRSRLLFPAGVPHVIKTLQMRFGRSELIIRSLMEKIRRVPTPKPEHLDTLIDFGLAVQNLVVHLVAAKQENHLNNPVLMQELIMKLPVQLRLDWARYKVQFADATLATFGEFMEQLIQAASEVTFDVPIHLTTRNEKLKGKERNYVHTHSDSVSTLDTGETNINRHPLKPCFACGTEGHRVAECADFQAKTVEERLKIVQLKNLCRTCLNFHQKWPCRSSRVCNVEGCQLKHHTLLHQFSTANPVHLSSNHNSPTSEKASQFPFFRILPVVVFGNQRQLTTFAFIDEGSSSTLLDRSIADTLGIDGPVEPLTLQWTGDVSREEHNSKRVQMEIAGKGKNQRYQVFDARTVDKLLLPTQTLPYQQLCDQYPHLRGLPIDGYELVQPKLLIGLDNLRLGIPLRIREGGQRGPVAAKCRLGWSIYGCRLSPTDPRVNVNLHVSAASCADRELNEQLRDYFTLELAGARFSFDIPESESDKRAKKLLKETTRRVASGFETGLLWKADDFVFPESYSMAVRRLRALEKKLDRAPLLKTRVHEQIEEYQTKGYAHRATASELATADPKRIWYLPLGVVTNPKKPNKVRLIWDAAAKSNGVSLNSMLLTGPDLLTPLPSVLSRFRQYEIAVCGDIREMFHRIQIRPEDRQSQRFLWRASPDDKPEIYVMDVATFGSTCSPSSAQYVKNLNAEQYMVKFPRAATAIRQNHYVDDYLDSFKTIGEAKEIVGQVKFIHSKGGFEIRNFQSNVTEVVRSVEGIPLETTKQLDLVRSEVTESILGMQWSPTSDVFRYTFTLRGDLTGILEYSHVPTKREILKVVMSLFDPLGFIAFFLIHGRILIQDVWASGIDWDTPVSQNLLERWKSWISYFSQLDSIRIPRAYFHHPYPNSCESIQLHIFVDASDAAYSCVGYFRVVSKRGVQIAFVAAKSKVAPLKVLSIPRLELKAAVLGTRLADFITTSHTFPISEVFFWTDSTTVLAWINSDHRRYHKFVGVRIGEILTSTKMNQWRWVPSKQNPADDATKWNAGPNFKRDNHWFCGPAFLYRSEKEWPQSRKLATTTEELKTVCSTHWETATSIIDCTRFSKWERLQRAQAYVLRFIDNLGHRNDGQLCDIEVLTQGELVRAEKLLWKQAQSEAYREELCALEKTKGGPNLRHGRVSKSSSIYRLWPYVDEEGILRMRGRIGAAEYASTEVKYPTILPRNHRISYLLADWYHRYYKHANQNTIVNEMIQRFEIAQLRVLVRQVTEQCHWCRVYKAVPRTPPMAPLPKERLTPYIKPFTYVGLDYFGPLFVKVGRSVAKRWVALFTCLTVRAVHLEVVHSSSSESCIMAIRRFIARRGSPSEFFSDNGTCFVGANKQLQHEMKLIATTFTNAQTRWNFNPPAAPHMGGVWERLVRSVKAAIGTIVEATRKPDDETLETILLDAESMINSRPLTYVSLESAEEESLTPNHFLLGNSSGVKQLPSDPVEYRTTLRSSWRLAQHITDNMWRRWIKEYLPVIRRRSKWFEEVRDIQEGDLVLVVSGDIRNQYTRGRVEKVFPGRDGRIRKALVRTSGGIYKRPVVKLALLDVAQDCKAGQYISEITGDHQPLRVGDCDGESQTPRQKAMRQFPQGSADEMVKE